MLFEVHSLKLLTAHFIIHNSKKCKSWNDGKLLSWFIIFSISANKYFDNSLDEMLQRQDNPDVVVAELPHNNGPSTVLKRADFKVDKLEKFMEDVR